MSDDAGTMTSDRYRVVAWSVGSRKRPRGGVRIAGPLVLVVAALASQPARAQPPAAPARVTAFENVTVVPADRARVIENQTVVVSGGRIAAMGPAGKTAVPAGATRVDGKGKFLMPGIMEMHGHISEDGSTESLAVLYLKLFVANGVTTVRGLNGNPQQLSLRDRINRGEVLGPRLFVYGPGMKAENAPNPETASARAREYKKAGYDGLKIQEGLSRATYAAIADTARKLKMPFAGHVPVEVGLKRALGAGQKSIEHLDGYLEALAGDPPATADASQPSENSVFRVATPELLDRVDETKIPVLAAATVEAGAMVVPTLSSTRTMFGGTTLEQQGTVPGLAYMPPKMVFQWVKNQTESDKQPRPPALVRRLLDLRERTLLAILASGGRVALGSDTPRRFEVPGFSLRRETKAMIDAGMNPWQVLQAATTTPAQYLGIQDDVGTVQVGKRADLILVDGNPLRDVANIFRASGVMVNGRWLPRAEIEAMLSEIARSVRFPPDSEIKDVPVTATESRAVTGSYRFDRGNQSTTLEVFLDKDALRAKLRGQKESFRLRSQGDGTYLVPEHLTKIVFHPRDARATTITIEADAAIEKGTRLP